MTRTPLRCLLLLLAALALPAPAMAQARFDFRTTPGHLSKDVRPSHYRLRFVLDPARDDFSGTVEIRLRLHAPAAAIELHAHELEAGSVRLVHAGRSRALGVQAQPATQTWRLVPADGAPIPAGEQRLQIDYRGKVHRSGEGLYRADHNVDGRPQRMLATQLEAIFARTLFPAFDEPVFRAVFELEVQAPAGLEVLSNMPRSSRSAAPNGVLHRFAPTPPMPSYLVAVAVGRFDVLEGRAAGVPLRVLTAPGKRVQARYAMQVSREVLPWFTHYFGQPYTLPRLDQLAVPSTRWGAMEDWGLISYAESELLFDPARSSPTTQRNVYEVVAHEIAHQWFGNLVTAASWSEIWLNEAFATWLAEKAADHFNPSWQMGLQRRTPIDRTMQRDAGAATRAIRAGPVGELQVNDVFDSITYAKGGAVLSMLEQWIGAARFQRGLAAYIAERRLSNATAGDLWFHIGRASGRDIAEVAASWTDQEGFPLVQVRGVACERGATRLEVTQRRFALGTAASSSPSSSSQRWQIPLRIARGTRTDTVLQTEATQTHRLPGCSAEPLVLNAGGAGFYRVEYEAAHLEALRARFAKLAPVDRVTLLSDAFALAQAGRVTMQTYFALLAAVPQVQGPGRAFLWSQAAEGLELLDKAVIGTAARAPLRAAARRLLAPELARLGWEPRADDDAEVLRLRGALIERLARFDDAEVVAEALRRFDLDDRGAAPLPASIRNAVVRAAGRHADRARFDRLRARLAAADGEEDRWMFVAALAAGRDAGRAAELLPLALDEALPGNIATSVPAMVARYSDFGALAYRYTQEHWQPLAARAGRIGQSWLLPGAAEGFNDRADAQRLVEDQLRHAGATGAALAAEFAARISLHATIRERDAAAFEQWLPAWQPAP